MKTNMPDPHPVTVTEQEIYEWLCLACRGFVENGIMTSDRVAQMSSSLAEDINRIEFSIFRIVGLQEINHHEVIIPLVEYSFGETRQCIDNASPQQAPDKMAQLRNMEGTCLNCEDLVYFAQVCEIGRKCIPKLWLDDDRLRDDLRAPRKHLTTLNEVWWLNLWHGLDRSRVIREAKINPQTESSIDWVFPILNTHIFDPKANLTIHLELKQISTSLEAYVHGDHAAPLKDIFQGVGGKFRSSSANEINVVGVTLFCELTSVVEEQIAKRFRNDPFIDAVLIWLPISQRKQLHLFYNDSNNHGSLWKKAALQTCLREPSIEDRARKFVHKHPLIGVNQQIHGPRIDSSTEQQ